MAAPATPSVNRSLTYPQTPAQVTLHEFQTATLAMRKTEAEVKEHANLPEADSTHSDHEGWKAERTRRATAASNAATAYWTASDKAAGVDIRALGNQTHVTKLYEDADLRKMSAISSESETIFSFTKILYEWSVTFNKARVLRMILLGKCGPDEVAHCQPITEAEWRQMYADPDGAVASNQFVKCKKAIFTASYERTFNTVQTKFSAIAKLKSENLESFTRRLTRYAKMVPSIYETYGCSDDGSVTTDARLAAKVRAESVTNTLLKHLMSQFPQLKSHVTYQTQADFDDANNKGAWLLQFVARIGDLMDQHTSGQAFLSTMAPPANGYGGNAYQQPTHSESDCQRSLTHTDPGHPAFFSNTNQVPMRPGGPAGWQSFNAGGQQPPPGPPPALRPWWR
jgi:hypothetical protein